MFLPIHPSIHSIYPGPVTRKTSNHSTVQLSTHSSTIYPFIQSTRGLPPGRHPIIQLSTHSSTIYPHIHPTRGMSPWRRPTIQPSICLPIHPPSIHPFNLPGAYHPEDVQPFNHPAVYPFIHHLSIHSTYSGPATLKTSSCTSENCRLLHSTQPSVALLSSLIWSVDREVFLSVHLPQCAITSSSVHWSDLWTERSSSEYSNIFLSSLIWSMDRNIFFIVQ